MLVRRLVSAAILAATLSSSLARADGPRDPARADALFQEGLAAVDRGDWAGGCPKFAQSFELDPAPSTMLRIAKCHQHDGKLAKAWREARQAVELNRNTSNEQRRRDLDDYARKLVAELEPKVAKVKIAVTPANAAVASDGETIPAALLGDAVALDAGAHVITASAPGYGEARRELNVAEGATASLSIELAPATVGGSGDATTPSRAGAPRWAFVAGGVGAACAVASVIFLVDERSAQSVIDEQCKLPGNHCGKTFDPASTNARLNRDFGLFVGLGAAGVAGLAAGVVGIFVLPRKSDATTGLRLDPMPGGASLRGTF